MVGLRRSPRLILALLAVAVGLVGCANPVPPSGGPRDTTPPSIRQSAPAAGSVNVPTDTRRLRLAFTEYVNRSSLVQSLSLTPAFERRLEFDWDGRAVDIELPDTLRDNTTYIVTIDTDMSDAHGVSLNEPLTVAFSTGPRINQGQIGGRIVTPPQGAPAPKIDVYAYSLPDTATRVPRPLPDRPAYRTQTGEDGTFAFDYMREQNYYVVGVQDANRNRRPDPQEATAPPPRLALPADSTASEVPVPWLLARVDTVAPSPQPIRAPSNRRLVLPFNEPVRLQRRATDPWVVRDSVSGARVSVDAVYRSPATRRDVVLRTETMQPRRHNVLLPAATVADTLGTPAAPDTLGVLPGDTPDTLRTRLRAFLPPPATADTAGIPLLPGVRPGLRFNQPPDTARLQRALTVQDTLGQTRPFALVPETGTTYRLAFDPPLASGEVVTVGLDAGVFADSDTTTTQRYRRVSDRQLGGLEGQLVLDTVSVHGDTTRRHASAPPLTSGSAGPDSAALSFGVELRPARTPFPMEPRRTAVGADSTFLFDQLPDGSFRFRAFLDRNSNGRWDPGRLVPYQPAEPLTWTAQPVESRPRWTNVLPDPLRIVVLEGRPPVNK
jgi:hypothetical protein